MQHREFKKLLTGYILSTIGDTSTWTLLVWVTLEQRGPAATSAVFAGSAIACLFGPLIGRWLDRYSTSRLLGTACLARCILMLLISLLSPYFVSRYAIVLSFINAFFALAYSPAVTKIIPGTFAADELPQANAVKGAASLVSSGLGPVLGGLLLAHGGLPAACKTLAGVFLVAMICVLSADVPRSLVCDDQGSELNFKRSIFKLLIGAPAMTTLVVLGVFLNFLLAPINSALAPLLRSLGAGPQGFGIAMALFVIGTLTGNIAAGGKLARKLPWKTSIFLSLALIAAGLISIGFCRSAAQAMAFLTLIGIAMPFLQVPYATQLQQFVPSTYAGQMFATLNAINMGSAPLGAAGAGLLLRALSPATLFIAAGLGGIILCYGWSRVRRPNADLAQ